MPRLKMPHLIILILPLWLCGVASIPSVYGESTVNPAALVKASGCSRDLGRPCVALVLGGGGARGSAHIGVLKALEELHIPVDLIVGTSIGSFVGGLYASGRTSDEIKAMFAEADWGAGYRDALNRSQIPNRRKRQLDSVPIHLDLGVDGRAIKLPKGFIQGQSMKALVDSMLGTLADFASFDQLPIAYRAVAADAETGEQVVLDSGDLATAMQMSMSLPGIVRPIEKNGRLLVDGGIANNLPISVAKDLGADIVIAVDIGSPALEQNQLSSGLTILRQLTSFLTRINVNQQKSLVGPNDLLLRPKIDNVTLLSFDKTLEAVSAGYGEARAQLLGHPALMALAGQARTSPSTDALQPSQAILFDRIVLHNRTRLGDDYILQRMGLQEGEAYSAHDIGASVDRLYGQGTIARVKTSWLREKGVNQLNVDVDEKEWGPNYLDFKLTFEDDFSSFSHFQAGFAYRKTNLSAYGAEWYSTLEVGTDKKIMSELYWPMGTTGFFWSTSGQYSQEVRDFIENNQSLGNVRSSGTEVKAGLGWNSVDSFEVMLSGLRLDGEVEIPSGLRERYPFKRLSASQEGIQLELNYDTLDHATFPKRGWKMNTKIHRTKDKILGFVGYSTQVDTEINGVVSVGRHSLRNLLRVQSTFNNDNAFVLTPFTLGGFLNLSGNQPNFASGEHVRFFSMVYTYELAANNFGAINLPLYLGLSAEAGNAWAQKSAIDYSDLINSASAFIGWDSPLGPAYLAYGHSDSGHGSLYAFLGLTF